MALKPLRSVLVLTLFCSMILAPSALATDIDDTPPTEISFARWLMTSPISFLLQAPVIGPLAGALDLQDIEPLVGIAFADGTGTSGSVGGSGSTSTGAQAEPDGGAGSGSGSTSGSTSGSGGSSTSG